jgi:hypothetical protein
MSVRAKSPEPSPPRSGSVATAASNGESPAPQRPEGAASPGRSTEAQKGLEAVIQRLAAMGIDDDVIAPTAGYAEGNGTRNVDTMLRGASTDPEARLAKLQALADGSIAKGLAAVISELQAAGDDDKTIMVAAGYAATSKPKESVEAMVKGTCKDAAEKYQRLEARAATYSRERVTAIVERLRQAGWTNDDIAHAAGYADGKADRNVDTLLTGDPKDVQSRYTALRGMMHRASQASRARSTSRK